jgi:hypothetical protein
MGNTIPCEKTLKNTISKAVIPYTLQGGRTREAINYRYMGRHGFLQSFL